jgi:hypothetical protein
VQSGQKDGSSVRWARPVLLYSKGSIKLFMSSFKVSTSNACWRCWVCFHCAISVRMYQNFTLKRHSIADKVWRWLLNFTKLPINRSTLRKQLRRGRLHSAFSMCVFMSDKPFVAEACPLMLQASASNGLSDIETHIENAPCNRPLKSRRFKCFRGGRVKMSGYVSRVF